MNTENAPSSSMRVLAAVVTHNRMDLLSRCLDHLLLQTRATDAILVINNGSTDGTVPMLVSRGIPHITQDNLGSAGGWHRAIQYAQDKFFDAVWLMDDDGYPADNALEVLVKSMTSDIACVSSVVVCEEDSRRLVFPMPKLNKRGLPCITAWPRKHSRLVDLRRFAKSDKYDFAHLFNGALISIAATRSVGNVDQSFFMFGDEVDYFFRLRTVGKVISVLNALHYHPDVSNRPYTHAKIYYYVKNSLSLNARYFDHPWLRNVMVIAAALFRTARRNGLAASASLLMGGGSGVFYTAIARGLRGEIAKDFGA